MSSCQHTTHTLEDRFGRRIRKLRISITDRCNLRCTYCMPEEGIEWKRREEILSYDEILRVVRIFHTAGIHSFRLTGGEPTVRGGFVEFVRRLQGICPEIIISMTTNGLLLEKEARDYFKAGIKRINISLDTLVPEKYHRITRRDAFQRVIRGIAEAKKYPFQSLKINAVALRDFNMDEITDFVEFSHQNKIQVRFIELMPFTGNNWEIGKYISKEEMLSIIRRKWEVEKVAVSDPSSTSTVYRIVGTEAKIGFIASVSESFCSTCDRVRLTTEGSVRTCLHSPHEIRLMDLLRGDASDAMILESIANGIKEKWAGHPDFRSFDYRPPLGDRNMILIGG